MSAIYIEQKHVLKLNHVPIDSHPNIRFWLGSNANECYLDWAEKMQKVEFVEKKTKKKGKVLSNCSEYFKFFLLYSLFDEGSSWNRMDFFGA